jgi:hypothetical protein
MAAMNESGSLHSESEFWEMIQRNCNGIDEPPEICTINFLRVECGRVLRPHMHTGEMSHPDVGCH